MQSGGQLLVGVHIKCKGMGLTEVPTILHSHGNATDIGAMLPQLM